MKTSALSYFALVPGDPSRRLGAEEVLSPQASQTSVGHDTADGEIEMIPPPPPPTTTTTTRKFLRKCFKHLQTASYQTMEKLLKSQGQRMATCTERELDRDCKHWQLGVELKAAVGSFGLDATLTSLPGGFQRLLAFSDFPSVSVWGQKIQEKSCSVLLAYSRLEVWKKCSRYRSK